MLTNNKDQLADKASALPGREQAMELENRHYVLAKPLRQPFPENMHSFIFGLGCFWGAEKTFWQLEGVYTTAVGYSGGITPNPNYKEVCSGLTAHNEVVLVVYDPGVLPAKTLLKVFWQSHDPTQGMRQGNDRGTQYRSGIYYNSPIQKALAEQSKADYQKALLKAGLAEISTEIKEAEEFYYAEDYHQQYLAKNPGGYCGLGGTGVEL